MFPDPECKLPIVTPSWEVGCASCQGTRAQATARDHRYLALQIQLHGSPRLFLGVLFSEEAQRLEVLVGQQVDRLGLALCTERASDRLLVSSHIVTESSPWTSVARLVYTGYTATYQTHHATLGCTSRIRSARTRMMCLALFVRYFDILGPYSDMVKMMTQRTLS
jgi:hypothetical protein